MDTAELVLEEIKSLPEHQVKEVLDFIAFLKERHDRDEWKNLLEAQDQSLSDVWDNEEDEVWNYV